MEKHTAPFATDQKDPLTRNLLIGLFIRPKLQLLLQLQLQLEAKLDFFDSRNLRHFNTEDLLTFL